MIFGDDVGNDDREDGDDDGEAFGGDDRDEEEINQVNKQRAIDSQIFTQLNVKDGEIRQLLEKITSQREAYRDLMQVSHHIVIILSLHFTINQHHITIRGLWDLLQQGLCQML